jgi:hypothetical protein
MPIGIHLISVFYKTLGMVGMVPPYLHTHAHVRTRPQEDKSTLGNSLAP